MINLVPVSRPCGTCTACCQGHLTGEAYGQKFYPGRPCAFVSQQGCLIYMVRPQDPCVSFKCAFKYKHNIPNWIRPDRSNVIFVERVYKGIGYIHGTDTGKKPVQEIFAWAKTWAQENQTYILVPRTVMRLATSENQCISIYGPDNKFRETYSQNTAIKVVD